MERPRQQRLIAGQALLATTADRVDTVFRGSNALLFHGAAPTLERMRGRLGQLVGVTCLLLCCAFPAAAHSSAICGPASAQTLAADGKARVYSQQKSVYGCIRGSRTSYKLGSASGSMAEGRVGPIALAGVDVAYGLAHYGVDVVSAEVVVKRLTDGVVLRDRDAFQGHNKPEYFETVDDIVVKQDGSVAWISSFSSIPSSGKTQTEVLKSDQTSRTLLDRSATIRRHSLRLRRSALSWKDGSAKRSARLR